MPSHLFVLTELYFRLKFLQRIGNLRKLLCHLVGILLLNSMNLQILNLVQKLTSLLRQLLMLSLIHI